LFLKKFSNDDVYIHYIYLDVFYTKHHAHHTVVVGEEQQLPVLEELTQSDVVDCYILGKHEDAVCTISQCDVYRDHDNLDVLHKHADVYYTNRRVRAQTRHCPILRNQLKQLKLNNVS
jgi:hypothetical protein